MKQRSSDSSISTATLIGVAWIGVLLVPVLSFLDRMVLISEIRLDMGLYGYVAVAVSLLLGLLSKTLLIFVVMVFSLRWLGWGRSGGGEGV